MAGPGGVGPKRKGTRYENELANTLWRRGYAVIRGPSSGGGARRRFQPDLVAIRGGVVMIFEVKYREPGRPIYLEASKVEKLREFASRAGGRVFVAVREAGDGWRFYPLEDLDETRGGNFKVPASGGLKLRDVEAEVFGAPRLDRFLDPRGLRGGARRV